MANTKLVIFKIGKEVYGLDIMNVNTVEKYIEVETAPDLPPNFMGVIHLRGNVIPVYSLRRKFELEDSKPSADTRFIITMSNEQSIAYEVDKMLEIAQFEEERLKEIPGLLKSKNTSYMKQITDYNEGLVILLNQDKILTEDELSKIKSKK